MSISSIRFLSQPAEFKVVGITTEPSPAKSARNRLRPWPPVITETPET